MGILKGKCKKNFILKAWELFRSFGVGTDKKSSPLKASSKSLSDNKKGQKIAPDGCFSVYVGPQRQRFVMKAKFVNHPLFKMLLEEAELEYGFKNDGPIWLPCNVDLFYKVLAEMDASEEDIIPGTPTSFTNAKGFSFVALRSQARLLCCMSGGRFAYRVMDSEMLKINQFQ